MATIIFGDHERKDILELDALSNDALKYNFGYGDAGIENLRTDAEEIRIEMIIENLTDTQYYCAKCEQVFEYRAIDQRGCEQCNAAIGDNDVAGRDES